MTSRREAIKKAVDGAAEALGSAINSANESRDERILAWVVKNIPGASAYEEKLRDYMEHPPS